jgi:hypothetical protein
MIMSTKYQMLACKFPEELLQVTRRHLNSMLAMATESGITKSVEYTIQKLNSVRGIISSMNLSQDMNTPV